MLKLRYTKAFTIVELLIVIVVIAILAAITIVAYNGIQQRARASSASTALSQASKKLALYQVDNGNYPGSLSAAGVTNNGDVDYQYKLTSSGYCVTATSGNVSYKITETGPPTSGGCAGHGQGGVAAITNLVSNPNATAVTGFTASGAAGNNTLVTGGDAYSGSTYVRRTYTAAGGNGLYYGNAGNRPPASAGTQYTMSAYVRTSKAVTVVPRIQWVDGGGTTISTSSGAGVSVNTTWTRASITATAPATTTEALFTFYATPSWAIGDTQDLDAIIFTSGDTVYSFADGSSPDWDWNGTANNSTSTGPPL